MNIYGCDHDLTGSDVGKCVLQFFSAYYIVNNSLETHTKWNWLKMIQTSIRLEGCIGSIIWLDFYIVVCALEIQSTISAIFGNFTHHFINMGQQVYIQLD